MLSGDWYSIVHGTPVSEYAVRKFQGMGNTTREAKYKAAAAANVSLGDAMPGISINILHFFRL